MNEPLTADQNDDDVNPVVVYRFIGLFLLVIISALLVFLFHQFSWPWFAVAFFVGAFCGILIGANFGIPLNSTVAAMSVTAGFLEGVYQGWEAYGLLGAVLGGPIGVLASVVLFMLTLMSISAVVILCGGNPFVSVDDESTANDIEQPQDRIAELEAEVKSLETKARDS